MSITTTLVRRNVMANKWRLLLTTVAVILGVGFVSSSFILKDSLNSVFSNLAQEINEDVDASIRTRTDIGGQVVSPPVPIALVDQVRRVDGVDSAFGNVTAFGFTIIGKDGKAKTAPGGPTIGLGWNSDAELSSLNVVDGRIPSGIDEVGLDQRSAKRAGYTVGDTVKLATPTGKRSLRLAATFRFGTNNNTGGAYLIAFDSAVASEIAGIPGFANTIDVRAKPGVTQAEVAQRVRSAIPAKYEVLDGAEVVAESEEQFSGFGDALGTGLLVFAFIAVFVSAFIIQNTFAILAGQRLRELALLRALGAAARQVRTMMMMEAAFVGIVGSVLGLIVGTLIALVLKAVMGAFIGNLPGGIVVNEMPIVSGIAVGMLVTGFAAIAPALRAGRVAPVAAMSDRSLFVIEQSTLRSVLAGLSATVGSALLVFGLFGRPGGTTSWLSISGVGAMLLFLGFAGLARLVAMPVLRVIRMVLRPIAMIVSWPFTLVFGRDRLRVVGDIAFGNVARTPRRTAAAAAALMIGLAFVGAGSTIGSSMKTTLNDQLNTSLKADLFITDFSGGISSVVTKHIGEVPGVGEVSGYKMLQLKIEGSSRGVAAVDHRTFGKLINLNIQDGSMDNLVLDRVFVHRDPASDLKLSVGSKVKAGDRTLEVVGIFRDGSMGTNWLIDESTFRAIAPGNDVNQFVAANVEPGASLQDVKDAVKTLTLDEAPSVNVEDRQEFQKSQEQIIDILITIINVLLALAVGIALIGIANTLALSIFERTREIGLMRAVGAVRSQTRTMVRWESVLTSVFGAVLGLLLGVGLGVVVGIALPEAAVKQISVSIPMLIAYVLLSIVAAIFAAILPARRAARMNVLQAISHV